MCTSLKYKSCFGRNFDYEVSYKEQLVNVPKGEFGNEYAVIGMCTGLVKDYPLLYDGMNEFGLTCGGLAFTGNAYYTDYNMKMKNNIPVYKFILHILGNYRTVVEVINDFGYGEANLTNEQYSEDFPNTDLHWQICDANQSIIIEQTKDGLRVYNGDVLTNNPPYPLQLEEDNVNRSFIGKTSEKSKKYFTRGTETEMLDGGYTSSERFTRVSYLKEKLEETTDKFNPISETFHLLQSVEQVYGATPVKDKFEYTIYSIVYDMNNKTVWVKTYDKLCSVNFTIGKESERVDII